MYIQLAGQIINYEHEGEGRPLILLHGNGEDHTIFDELIHALSGSFSIYAMDTRGHGGSASPKEYHYREMAEDVYGLIRALELDRPLLLGFSDGAILGLLTAIKHPTSLSGLLICGANRTPKGLKWGAAREIRARFHKTGDPLLGLMLKEPDITDEELSEIRIPVLVLAGENDLIKEKETRAIAAQIPGSRLMILPNEDHASYVVHSSFLKDIILHFAQR